MFHIRLVGVSGRLAIVAILIACSGVPVLGDLMVVGGDNKVAFDGPNIVFEAPGRDVVSLIDIGADPANPKIIANLPLMNSVFGPPTNLAITPDESLALVANAMN
ncbi:uncharacterized protein METZ01_LOCUS302900, partial [marine metagenome]